MFSRMCLNYCRVLYIVTISFIVRIESNLNSQFSGIRFFSPKYSRFFGYLSRVPGFFGYSFFLGYTRVFGTQGFFGYPSFTVACFFIYSPFFGNPGLIIPRGLFSGINTLAYITQQLTCKMKSNTKYKQITEKY